MTECRRGVCANFPGKVEVEAVARAWLLIFSDLCEKRDQLTGTERASEYLQLYYNIITYCAYRYGIVIGEYRNRSDTDCLTTATVFSNPHAK